MSWRRQARRWRRRSCHSGLTSHGVAVLLWRCLGSGRAPASGLRRCPFVRPTHRGVERERPGADNTLLEGSAKGEWDEGGVPVEDKEQPVVGEGGEGVFLAKPTKAIGKAKT